MTDTPKRRGRPPKAESINRDLADALKSLADATMKQAEENSAVVRAKEMTKAMYPQNQSPPRISDLNPRGDKDYPRPDPIYDKLFLPWQAEKEDLTREELELINLIQPGEYSVRRHDGTEVKIDAKVVTNDVSGKPEQFWLISPMAFSSENRLLMPSLVETLRQMAGDAAKDVMPMDEERRLVASGELGVSIGG